MNVTRLLLFFALLGCGSGGGSEAPCVAGEDPGRPECTSADQDHCSYTCVCEQGELEAGTCLGGSCMAVDSACGTGCPNFDLGEWTGDWCS